MEKTWKSYFHTTKYKAYTSESTIKSEEKKERDLNKKQM